ncbi:MAG: ATP-binding cassette domain-containing protein [Pseudomonadota bacterium]
MDLHRSGRAVLRNVSWTVNPGERWLVLGPNGAGKTQLLKVLAGDVWPNPARKSTRQYRLHGQWQNQPHEARDEIAWLGPERQDRYERHDWNFPVLEVVGTGLYRTDIPLEPLTPAQRKYCIALLRRAGIAPLAKRNFLSLSYGERRLVLLARAWAWRPGVLLLDEAATGLDPAHRARLQRFLAAGRSRISWVCTAHREEDAPVTANRLLVLDGGRISYCGLLSRSAMRRAAHPAPAKRRVHRRVSPAATLLVSLENADVYLDGSHILRSINMEVRRGQCWVLHGANGSGKSTLLRTIYGDHGVASGGIIFRAGIAPGVALEQFRAHTALVSPQLQTDYPHHYSVLETIVSGLHSSIGLNACISALERRRAQKAMRHFGLGNVADRTLGELSYGQKRRVLFARASMLNPQLMLLDEPFAGLDIRQRELLLQALEMQIRSGRTVVLATHYRSEWPRGATHEMHLSGGKVQYAGTIRR